LSKCKLESQEATRPLQCQELMLSKEILYSIHQPAKRIQMAGSEEPAKVGEGTNGGLWIGPPLHRLLKNTSVALRPGSVCAYVSRSLSTYLSSGGRATCVYQGRERTATGSPGREYATGRRNCFQTPPDRHRLSLSLLFSLVSFSLGWGLF